MSDRPAPEEYAQAFEKYVSLVPDGVIAETLAAQAREAMTFFEGITDEQSTFRYAPGKWSVREVLGHLADTERIFAYRALAISRGEQQALPGFDQDAFVAQANFDDRPVRDLLAELRIVRAATLSLFESFTPEIRARVGTSSRGPLSVRACGFVIAGHELYHVVRLKGDYLI